jgi:hypothetical protein
MLKRAARRANLHGTIVDTATTEAQWQAYQGTAKRMRYVATWSDNRQGDAGPDDYGQSDHWQDDGWQSEQWRDDGWQSEQWRDDSWQADHRQSEQDPSQVESTSSSSSTSNVPPPSEPLQLDLDPKAVSVAERQDIVDKTLSVLQKLQELKDDRDLKELWVEI